MNQDRIVGGDATSVGNVEEARMQLGGVLVSLNLPMRAFLKLDGRDFILNQKVPSGRLPRNLTPNEERQIATAIRRGELLVNVKPVLKPAKQPKALESQIAILKASGIGVDVIKNMINGIVRLSDSDPKLGGHTRYEALETLFKLESELAARKDVLEHLASAMDYVPGARPVVDEPAAPRARQTSSAPVVGQPPEEADLGEI
jgi:hypothetical protein